MPKARPRAIKYDHMITSVNSAGFRVTHKICNQGLGQGFGVAHAAPALAPCIAPSFEKKRQNSLILGILDHF